MRNKTFRHFSILATTGGLPSGVAVTVDILETASKIATRLKLPSPEWDLYSVEGGVVDLQNGMAVRAKRLPKNKRALLRSLLVIPGAGMSSTALIQERMAGHEIKQMTKFIKAHVEAGGSCAASCSSVFILQGAGLLKEKIATTTWWLAPYLQKLEPTCHLKIGSLVCQSGTVVTAGAALAQSDLMLYLLKKNISQVLAEQVARYLLLDGDRAQSQFITPAILTSGNHLASSFQFRVESVFPEAPNVKKIASELAMTERTLHRQLKQATGMSPSDLIQLIRFHRAQSLLASKQWSIEEVAAQVGYQDTTALRRLMKKVSGRNPMAFKN